MDNCTKTERIVTEPRRKCYLCRSLGEGLYGDVEDWLFGAPGKWGFRRCPNLDCGLIWLDPVPIESEMAKAYLSYYTHKGDVEHSSSRNNQQFMRARLAGVYGHFVHYSGLLCMRKRMLTRLFENERPGRLLEIGCGDGNFIADIKKQGWEVMGVDSDPEAARVAMAKYGVSVLVGRFEDIDLPQDYYNVVVINHVIEHVSDPVLFLARTGANIAPGGRIIVVTPNSAGFGHAAFGANWRGLDPPRHLHIFTPVNLVETVRKAGLNCMHLSTTSVNAEAIFAGSTEIRNRRQHLSENGSGFMTIFSMWGYQFFTVVKNCFARNSGEEVIVVCGKQSV
jgi:2-polyprenyl-3-methyl-5-hydroxy-6-metoxy-1,4-benzoquinol methylase